MNDFHKLLREEILQSQARRSDLVKHKFTFVISAFGLGSLAKVADVNTLPLLFLAPAIALAFDLYILGEDFGIKRAGAFIGRCSPGSPPETSDAGREAKAWEQFVSNHRDRFAVVAGPLLSGLTTFAAALMYSKQSATSLTVSLGMWWYVVMGICSISLATFACRRNRQLQRDAALLQPPSSG